MSNHPESSLWDRMRGELLDQGYAVLPRLCSEKECTELASMWGQESLFRKHVISTL